MGGPCILLNFMPSMVIPPWLIPPDPVATYQRGMQIGASIGAQQAQQRMAELTAARQEQEAAQRQANFETKMQMQAAETARRVQAQMRYRQAVESGVEPMQAMMTNPELFGSSLAGVAQMMKEQERTKRLENFQPNIKTISGHEFAEIRPGQYQFIKPPPELSNVAEDVLDTEGNPSGIKRVGNHYFREPDTTGKLTMQDRAKIGLLRQELQNLNKTLSGPQGKEGTAYRAAWDKANNRRQQILQQLQELGVYDADMDSNVTGATSPLPVQTPTTIGLPKIKNFKVE